MARVPIAINTVPPNGLNLNAVVWTAADEVNEHEFVNDGYTVLLMKNGHTGAQVAVINSVPDQFGRSQDTTLTVAASGVGVAGPFLQGIWNQAGAKVFVDVTDDTAVEFAALRLSQVR